MKRLREKLRLQNKSFQEIVTTNLYGIFVWNLIILAFASTIAFLFVPSMAQSRTESAQTITNYETFLKAFPIIFAAINAILVYYARRKIAGKIERSSLKIQYHALLLREGTLKLLMLSLILTLLSPCLNSLATTVGQNVAENLLLQKGSDALLSLGISLFLLAFIYLFVSAMEEEEAVLSFRVIQNFEKVTRNTASTYSVVNVWKFLMKRIIHATENMIRGYLETFEVFHSDFYKPFSTISLAAVLGDSEQRGKAKEWVADLGKIVMKKSKDPTRVRLIIRHLDYVEKDEIFRSFQSMQDKYGFQYDFEHGRKKLTGALGKIVVPLLSAVEAIIVIIELLFHIT